MTVPTAVALLPTRCLLQHYHSRYTLEELLWCCPPCRAACACSSCLRDADHTRLVPPLQYSQQQQQRQARYVLREVLPHLSELLQQQQTEVCRSLGSVVPWQGQSVSQIESTGCMWTAGVSLHASILGNTTTHVKQRAARMHDCMIAISQPLLSHQSRSQSVSFSSLSCSRIPSTTPSRVTAGMDETPRMMK